MRAQVIGFCSFSKTLTNKKTNKNRAVLLMKNVKFKYLMVFNFNNVGD